MPDDIYSSGEAYYSIFQISSLTFVLSQFTAKVSLEGFLDEVNPEAQWTSIGQQSGDVVRAEVETRLQYGGGEVESAVRDRQGKPGKLPFAPTDRRHQDRGFAFLSFEFRPLK